MEDALHCENGLYTLSFCWFKPRLHRKDYMRQSIQEWTK